MPEVDPNGASDAHPPGLWGRRVPHIMGLYLAGAYTVFEMAQWVVKRFSLSSAYEDMCFSGLLSLLPGVALLAWGHGAPGRDTWTLKDKIGIPVNLLCTLGLLAAIWMGREEGASVKGGVTAALASSALFDAGLPNATIDEPADFRATVLAFAFVNRDQSPERDWFQHAIPLALEIDLEQESRITLHATTAGGLFGESLRKAGIENGLRVPLGLMRDVAKEGQYDYFLSGSYAASEEGQEDIVLTLYEAANGSVVATHQVRAGDLLSAVDLATLELKASLGLSEQEIAQETDLPVAEQGTSSLPALRSLSMALVADRFERDFDKGLLLMDQALELDQTFAFAYLRKASMLIEHDKWPELAAVVQAAQKHSYRLSAYSRSVLQVIQLWLVDKKPAEALIAAEQWVKRSPKDATALQILTNIRFGLGDMNGSLAALESLMAIENKPGYRAWHAKMLASLGRLIEARDEYLALTQDEPLLTAGYMGLGSTSRQLGEHDAALDAYRKAVATEPTSTEVLQGLASQMRSMGSYEQAGEQYSEAIARSETPREAFEAHRTLADFYWYRGQMQRALAELTRGWALVQDLKTPDEMAALRLDSAWMFAKAGMREQALSYVEAAESSMTADDKSLSAFKFYVMSVPFYWELGDLDQASAASDKAREIGLSFGFTEAVLSAATGRLLLKRGAFKEAAAKFEAYLKEHPTETRVVILLAEAQYELGLDDKAEEQLQDILRAIPADPEAHLLMAKVRARQGKNKEASSHLELALKAWSSADEGFALAAQARALRESLPR